VVAKRKDAVDRACIIAFRGSRFLKPARQLIRVFTGDYSVSQTPLWVPEKPSFSRISADLGVALLRASVRHTSADVTDAAKR
jgi:hypothetical protein